MKLTDWYGPTHGVDNWQLVEYEWDPETGVATMLYEHDDGRTMTRTADQTAWLP
jgi:hypothetical protein